MSNMKIRFKDPNSGRTHEVAARLMEAVDAERPQSAQGLKHDANDGKIDLFMTDIGRTYAGKRARHVQIDSSALSDAQVKALMAAAQSGQTGAIEVQAANRNVFNAVSIRTDLALERPEASEGAQQYAPDQSLVKGANLLLSEEGVLTLGGTRSSDMTATASALYSAAEAIDALPDGENLFARNHVPLAVRAGLVSALAQQLEAGQASDLNPQDKAQLRSSVSTILTEVIAGLGNQRDQLSLKSDAMDALGGLIENETIGGLHESMVLNTIRLQAGLTDGLAQTAKAWEARIAPAAPPYEKWFKDGKNEINISLAAGHGEGFYEGMTEFLTERNFSVIEEGSSWPRTPRHLQFTKEVNGQERTVNIYLRHFSTDSFKDIDNDKMDMIVYQGHSNLGENTRNSLEKAPDATGDGKLIFLGLCSGKDNIDRVRKAFPSSQLITTFNSSYFNTKTLDDGGKQFRTGEDAKALMCMIEGFVEKQGWQDITDRIRRVAVGYHHRDSLQSHGNYVSPLDAQIAARFRDVDSDGKADVLDKHFNVETLTVESQPGTSFAPEDPAVSDRPMNGELPHTAAAFANTIDLYNPTYRGFSHHGRILSDGYYDGADSDPIVRFETKTVDGEKIFAMRVNNRFAHLGEESLRAVTMIEYNRHLSQTEEKYPIQDPVKAMLVGILTAGASLNYDHGYRDAAVFGAMAKHYGWPEGLKWSDARSLIQKEKHHYTGSSQMAEAWMAKLDDATLEALQQMSGTVGIA